MTAHYHCVQCSSTASSAPRVQLVRGGTVMTASQTTPGTTAAGPLAVLERILTEGFATGNADIVDELCAPDLVEHQFGMAGTGAEAIAHVKDAIRQVHAAAPDMSFSIEDTVESGDTIWVRVQARGTATGPFFGPPSGRP